MNYPIPFILVAMCVLNLALGFYIISLDPGNRLHNLFFIHILLGAMFAFVTMMGFIAEEKETFLFWFRFRGITLMNLPLQLHVNMELLKIDRKIKIPVLIIFYALTLSFVYPLITQQVLYKDFIKTDGIWMFERFKGNILNLYYVIMYYSTWFLTSLLQIRAYRRSKIHREKRQAMVLFLFYVAYYIFCFSEFYVMPFFSDKHYNLHPIYGFLVPCGITIAIIRYKFLAVTPELVSREVVENIKEFIILLDRNFNIVFMNPAAKKFLTDQKNGITEMITEYDFIDGKLREIRDDTETRHKTCLNFIFKNNTKRLLSVRLLGVKDRFRDITGILLIAGGIKGMKKFLSRFGLTVREMDVIASMITGTPVEDIAEKLAITKSTVKSHMEHIFSKTDVSSKMELLNLLKEYDIVF